MGLECACEDTCACMHENTRICACTEQIDLPVAQIHFPMPSACSQGLIDIYMYSAGINCARLSLSVCTVTARADHVFTLNRKKHARTRMHTHTHPKTTTPSHVHKRTRTCIWSYVFDMAVIHLHIIHTYNKKKMCAYVYVYVCIRICTCICRQKSHLHFVNQF